MHILLIGLLMAGPTGYSLTEPCKEVLVSHIYIESFQRPGLTFHPLRQGSPRDTQLRGGNFSYTLVLQGTS